VPPDVKFQGYDAPKFDVCCHWGSAPDPAGEGGGLTALRAHPDP